VVVRYGTVLDLRRANRSALIRALYFNTSVSRQELGAATGLSQATISNVVNELMDDGLVVEAGVVSSDGGRPRTLVQVNPEFGYVIGVDIGETRIRVALFNLALGTPLAISETLLEPAHHEVDTAVSHLARSLSTVIAEAGVDESDVIGVGIGVSGIVEHGAEILVHGQSFAWDAVPLARLLREAGVTAPIFVDNGAANLGQAENWFGASRGAKHAIVTLIGSGVGASVITDGSRYRGATTSASEWGHTPIAIGGRPCRCGSRGCLEAYLGAEAILARYHEAGQARSIDTGQQETDLARLLELGDTDPTARQILDETVQYLGAGIGSLINLFNPERVIIGGWAGTLLCARLLPRIRAEAADHALRQPFAQTSIEPCTLGDDALALGAATLPVEQLLSTTRLPLLVASG
jgi:predicted NBD/HSP70 family sugar kinase/biotin operon repressor